MADPLPTRMIRQQAFPFLAVKTGADKTYAMRPHSHETLSVGIVEQGSSVILCHPLEFKLKPGSAVLIPPGTIHLCQPDDPERFIFKMIYICPDWLKAATGIRASGLAPGTAALTRADLERTAAFLDGFQTGDAFLDETRALEFIGHLLTARFKVSGTEAASPPLPGDRMARVKKALDEGFADDIRLDDLAARTGTSKYGLIRQFKARWQITPHAYVINLRINLAKQLLRQGESVAHTAAECGFFDQSHFIKTFKNFTGIRPADYTG